MTTLVRWMAIFAAPVLLTGCAGTASVEHVKGVTVCLDGKCGPAQDRFTRDQMIASLLVMYKANENTEGTLCDSDPTTRACSHNFLSFFVQGGPVPGVSTFGSPYISGVGLDKKTLQIKYASSSSVTWMATPVLCENQYTEISVESATDIVITKPSFACVWTVVPHVWNAKFAVDYIDFDHSIVAGKYSIRGGGLLTAGGGSGTFTLRLPKENTLVVQGAAGKVVAPATLTQLPTKILAAPVPSLEQIQQTKQEEARDPAEQKLWESVSAENTASAYQRYLDAYPNGRFISGAKANLAVVREQEARTRELDQWTRIKDSANPADFQTYLADFPKGTFTDLATIRMQRLKAAEGGRTAQDTEQAYWEQVRDSSDPAELDAYLKQFPNGQFAKLAQVRLDTLRIAKTQAQDLEMVMWNQIKDSRNPEDYRRYVQTFPKGLFADLAAGRAASLTAAAEQGVEIAFWDQIKASTTASDFLAYLKKYPNGQFAPLARQLVSQLGAVAQEQGDITLWTSVQNSSHPQDFAAYLTKYPLGRFAELARNRKADLEQAASYKNIEFGRYFALVIGINKYPNLGNLATAIHDARAVAKELESDYGFNVSLLVDADRKQIIDALSERRRALTDKDNLLIYYAGHGYLDTDSDRGYWLPSDSERDSPANWISTADITDSLKAMRARHVLVVADSCYSGTLARDAKIDLHGPDFLRRMAEKRARVALTSGGLEPVLDGGGGGHSVFASAFLDVLRGNRSVIEGTRLFSELRRPVISGAPQTPEYSEIRFAGHEGGDFLFVRRAN